ncbi:Uncharacterised protein [Candidatus Venteria ishoeyi]|uniref:Uncharacterized protein n=1 Tax=Candidatus Venteria ishoeyi TaxID=1899563 RepID=A0A1H6F7I5_9GAMM|nr:Uncharacterised protein [Candidatus Venteria ishoeyi]
MVLLEAEALIIEIQAETQAEDLAETQVEGDLGEIHEEAEVI